MKFWQLLSIADGASIAHASLLKPNWIKFGTWIEEIDNICIAQDREKLDAILDVDFVLAVLQDIQRCCYLSIDGRLRSRRLSIDDIELSFIKVFQVYGGEMLEEVCEKGSVIV